jgi:hypothetical protein
LRNLHPSTAIIARPEDLEIGGPEPFKRTGEAVLLLEGDDPIDIEIVEAVLKSSASNLNAGATACPANFRIWHDTDIRRCPI